MRVAPALPELQRQFLAALYDEAGPESEPAIVGRGLEPAARLRIYRNSCGAIHGSALRTSYPAILALVGEDYFDQTARGYRRTHPSRSGNLQVFGARFAEYLEAVPELGSLPYLPDVARLEWLRQQCVLADETAALPHEVFATALTHSDEPRRVTLHPSVRLLDSRHPVLTIWRYAMEPTPEGLVLGAGESVVLWREGGEVVMDAVDRASFACIASLARGDAFNVAHGAARALDAAFDFAACMESLIRHSMITAVPPCPASQEPPPCR